MIAAVSGLMIDLQDVAKTYHTAAGEVIILSDIKLQVRRGEFVCVVGPSGSGKSTLLNMITGIDRPTRGDVRVSGEALHELAENHLAPVARTERRRHLPVLAAAAHSDGAGERRPADGLLPRAQATRSEGARDAPAGCSRHRRSGGQAARRPQWWPAATSRNCSGVGQRPPLIVGDEPTGNLDLGTANEVFGLFEKLADQGRTLIAAFHDQSPNGGADRRLHVVDGRLDRDEGHRRGRQSGRSA